MRISTILVLLALFLAAHVVAAEKKIDQSQPIDHSKHGKGYGIKTEQGQLKALDEIPVSGRAREAGSDNRYAMEPTSAHDSLALLCAKGSRGLIMLDRNTIEKCGGRTKGMPEPHDSNTINNRSTHQH